MTLSNLDQRYHLLCDTAICAGIFAQNLQDQVLNGTFEVNQKGIQDFVTLADQQTEAFIQDKLLSAFPEDGF